MFAVQFVDAKNTRFNVHSGRCNLREKLKSGGLFFPLDDGLVIDRIRVINVTTDRRRKLFSKLDTYLSSPNRSERSNSSVIQMIRVMDVLTIIGFPSRKRRKKNDFPRRSFGFQQII